MASNRLYVRCAICHAEVPIARVSAGETEWTPARGEAVEEWRAFLVEHLACDPKGRLHVELSSENEWMIALAQNR
jgi:hypothetical protein